MSSILPLPENPAPEASFSFGGYVQQADQLAGVSFWPRAGARIIDLIIHYIVSIFSGLMIGFMVGFTAALTHQSARPLIHKLAARSMLAFFLALVGDLVYHIVCDKVSGSTLGKIIFSMVVVQEDGAPCRIKSAVVRNLGYYIDSLFFGLIGYSAMKDDVAQQRYGDRWAQTVVCKRSELPLEKRSSAGRFVLGFMLACMADSAIIMISLIVKLMA